MDRTPLGLPLCRADPKYLAEPSAGRTPLRATIGLKSLPSLRIDYAQGYPCAGLSPFIGPTLVPGGPL